MTTVKCYATKCEYNDNNICSLTYIELDETDMEWKDCAQAKSKDGQVEIEIEIEEDEVDEDRLEEMR